MDNNVWDNILTWDTMSFENIFHNQDKSVIELSDAIMMYEEGRMKNEEVAVTLHEWMKEGEETSSDFANIMFSLQEHDIFLSYDEESKHDEPLYTCLHGGHEHNTNACRYMKSRGKEDIMIA